MLVRDWWRILTPYGHIDLELEQSGDLSDSKLEQVKTESLLDILTYGIENRDPRITEAIVEVYAQANPERFPPGLALSSISVRDIDPLRQALVRFLEQQVRAGAIRLYNDDVVMHREERIELPRVVAEAAQPAVQPPRLVSITVIQNAQPDAAHAWHATYDANSSVIVEATTTPNNNAEEWNQIVWTNGVAVAGFPNRRAVPRAVLGQFHVEAQLGGVTDFVDVTVQPVLVRVDVTANAQNTGGKAWSASYEAAGGVATAVVVQAVTAPGNVAAEWAQIVWANGTAGAQPNQRIVPRNALGQTTVTAQLGGVSDHADITVQPILVRVDVIAQAHNTGGKAWKSFFDALGGAPNAVVVRAVTAPDTAAAWALIAWTNGAPGPAANQRVVLRDAVGQTQVTAALGGVSDHADIRVCQPPVLAIHAITFSGHRVVEQDTLGDFAAPEWVEARAVNHPVAYNRNTPVQLGPTFRIVTPPTEPEQVVVEGTCNVAGAAHTFTGNLAVNPAQPAGQLVTTAAPLASNQPLPNHVGCYDPVAVTWTATPTNGEASAAGASSHTIYAMLGPGAGPVVPAVAAPDYWTLLEVSCRAAHGLANVTDVIDRIFAAFTGRNVVRKRDARQLTYWNPDNTNASSTQLLLARVDGSGQCGSWAELFRDMCRVHGIDRLRKVYVAFEYPPGDVWFLVKHWQFHGVPALANAWTHVFDWPPSPMPAANRCSTRPPHGLPGQGNPDPPPCFGNHFIVIDTVTGVHYDPSYGAHAGNRRAWELAAIEGLVRFAPVPPQAGYSTAAGAVDLLLHWDCETGNPLP